jgi:UDP-N-acetyl-D-glucosamine dehydrogenase
MNYKNILLNKIKTKKSVVGIIGLGYVGLPLAGVFAKKNFNVIGFDIDSYKINMLNKGKSYIKHIKNEFLGSINKKLIATTNFANIQNVDVIIICLPTPLTNKNNPDLSFITLTLNVIKKFLKKGQIIILESSTYPGSTKQMIQPIIKEKKFILGHDFFLGYSPEREDPSNKKYNISNIPKLLSGSTFECKNITSQLYSKVVKEVVLMSSIEAAEFTKIFENTFRSVNIALVNELKLLSTKTKLNINEIISAASTKPFGFKAFQPGPGVGGHCIPIDPYYLSWVAKKNNIKMNFIGLAGKINDMMPKWIIGESFKGRNIKKALILGVAYKKNVDDMRESPGLEFIKILLKKKIKVDYHDPYIKTIKTRKFKRTMKSIDIKKISNYDIVYLLTDHDIFNYSFIKHNAKFIIDTRNVYKSEIKNKIMKL